MSDYSGLHFEDSVQNPCCSYKCVTTVSEEVKNKFQNDFELCKSLESKRVFIVAHVQDEPLLTGKKRQFRNIYRIAGQQICCKSFCQILGISKHRVLLALKKRRAGNLDDMRKGGNRALADEARKAIIDHINSFPHCRRETSESMYLDPELNPALMYRLFQEKWSENHKFADPPCQNTYKKIFASMGLKFKNLTSDPYKPATSIKIVSKSRNIQRKKQSSTSKKS